MRERGRKKKVPIWLAITPTAAVKRVGTTVVLLLAQQRGEKEGGMVWKRDGFT